MLRPAVQRADGRTHGRSAGDTAGAPTADALRRQNACVVEHALRSIVTPTNRIPLVQNGTVDLECSTTTNTLARQRDVDFSPSIFIAGVAAAVKTRSGIDSFADLGGKTVATVSGSTSIQLLRALRKADKTEINEIHGKDTSETFLLLTGDSAAAMILEDVQLAGLIASSTAPAGFKILRERLRHKPYGFMFRKDDPKFKEVVDQTLAGLMKSGEINQIYEKWFTKVGTAEQCESEFPNVRFDQGGLQESEQQRGVSAIPFKVFVPSLP